MLGKARQYKGYDFTDSVQVVSQRSNGYSIVLQDNVKNSPLRTIVSERANFHGGYSSATLAGSRLFQFTGKVIGTTKDQRGTAWDELIDIIKPEGNPNVQGRGFYPLTWMTDTGESRTCDAKVYAMPEPTNELTSPIIDFQFTLLSETEKVYNPTVNTVSGYKGYFGGITLPIPLPTYLAGYSNSFNVRNEGNRDAPCKITVTGTATNPKIFNLTNENRYRHGATTTELVLDNRNLNNNPSEIRTVTDNGINVKGDRSSGSDIFLSPGDNYIVLLTDNPSDTPTITVTYRDTYIY